MISTAAFIFAIAHCGLWVWLLTKARSNSSRFPLFVSCVVVHLAVVAASWLFRLATVQVHNNFNLIATGLTDLLIALVLVGSIRISRRREGLVLGVALAATGIVCWQLAATFGVAPALWIGRLVLLLALLIASAVSVVSVRRSNDRTLESLLFGIAILVSGQLIGWIGVYAGLLDPAGVYLASSIMSLLGWFVVARGFAVSDAHVPIDAVPPWLVAQWSAESFEGYVDLRRGLLRWAFENRGPGVIVFALVQCLFAVKQLLHPTKNDIEFLVKVATRVIR